MSQRNFFELYHQSITQPELFWGQQATKYLDWDNSWDRVLTGNFNQKNIRWFTGGYLNACFNCLDRHLLKHAEKPAIIWESDNSLRSKILNYRELFLEVCRFANVLLDKGIKKGDRVCIYLPMIPEAIIAVLACARIGAVHSVVFAGFSALALQNRILDADCHLVITADGGNRGGKFIPLKSNVDEALLNCPKVKTVIVVKHTNQPIPWFNQRDFCWSELVEASSLECFPASMEATSPLFILYTSGSTGKPKGILHATAGYLLHTAISFDWVFNYQLGEVFWCTADVGWITGHSYVIYGPLLNGATLVLYEGVPNFPTFSRYWEIIDKYKVNIFYTAPTAIRSLMGEGDHHLTNTSRNSLRLLGTVGEPINPEAWRWYYEVVGNSVLLLIPGGKQRPVALCSPQFSRTPIQFSRTAIRLLQFSRTAILSWVQSVTLFLELCLVLWIVKKKFYCKERLREIWLSLNHGQVCCKEFIKTAKSLLRFILRNTLTIILLVMELIVIQKVIIGLEGELMMFLMFRDIASEPQK